MHTKIFRDATFPKKKFKTKNFLKRFFFSFSKAIRSRNFFVCFSLIRRIYYIFWFLVIYMTLSIWKQTFIWNFCIDLLGSQPYFFFDFFKTISKNFVALDFFSKLFHLREKFDKKSWKRVEKKINFYKKRGQIRKNQPNNLLFWVFRVNDYLGFFLKI
jgi:hypothetical protein